MKKIIYLLVISSSLLLAYSVWKPIHEESEKEAEEAAESRLVADAMDFWTMSRSYPEGRLRNDLWAKAYFQLKSNATLRNDAMAEWQTMGPKNIAGRTLCLAFHPTNADIIYAGSASGGLWKTTTAGVGAEAWVPVPTGFPVLGVAAMAIDPDNPLVMYIGTGEVYKYQNVGTGFTQRTNRGTYGIGILKTSDGGLTWSKSLDWAYSDLRGVQRIVINPKNANSLWAATSEGLYRSYDAGASWQNINATKMAVDIDMNPQDTNIVYVTFGSIYNEDIAGVYRTNDAGQSFEALGAGQLDAYSGKTLLDISKQDPNILYASVADLTAGKGLYKSTDAGDNWTKVSSVDVPKYQGWFAHDVAINPNNSEDVIHAGVDVYRSVNGGFDMQRMTYWYNDYPGVVAAGEDQGTPDYVHADIHAIYYHPLNQKIYFATDGGMFVSEDGGVTFDDRSGGMQTAQFYAPFSSSFADSTFALGGLQDNSTAVYYGDSNWSEVIGGDGMGTAADPQLGELSYASLYYLRIFRSFDNGFNYSEIGPAGAADESPNFNSPFRLAPSSPQIIYGAAQTLYRSDDYGDNWNLLSNSLIDNGNPALAMAVSPSNDDELYVSTSPINGQVPSVRKTTNAGVNWQTMQGLPNRLCMDIVYHPSEEQRIYTVFGGFGTSHLYQSNDAGATWEAIGTGLPDVPHNALVIDPLNPNDFYIANDLGVFYSIDAGLTWESYMDGLPDAALAMSLSISPVNRKLRVATHGHGAYQGNLVHTEMVSSIPDAQLLTQVTISPNPIQNECNIALILGAASNVQLSIYNIQGQVIQTQTHNGLLAGQHHFPWDARKLSAGIYICMVEMTCKNGQVVRRSVKVVKE